MKLFPAKISERETSMQDLWRQRVTVHCYSQKVAEDRRYFTAKFNEFHASKFQAIQKNT